MEKTNYIALIIAMIITAVINRCLVNIIQEPEKIERLGILFLSIFVAVSSYIIIDKITKKIKGYNSE